MAELKESSGAEAVSYYEPYKKDPDRHLDLDNSLSAKQVSNDR